MKPTKGSDADRSGYHYHIKDDFGAVGDGGEDDTKALQEAFACGRTVLIPEGVYRFTDTIQVARGTKVFGQGSNQIAFRRGLDPAGQTILRYDGSPGQIAMLAEEAHHFQMRQVTIDGNGRAGTGIRWQHSTSEAWLEDCTIRGCTEHGLFITRTWYASFTRLVVQENLGSGVTLSSEVDPVNWVNFINCRFQTNGLNDEYSEDNLASGYGLGLLGAGAVINLWGGCFEFNGGPGLYIEGPVTNLLVSGCYFEQNCGTPIRQDQELHGKQALLEKKRQPTGRWVSILENCRQGSNGVVFDNVYMHPKNGIWFHGSGAGEVIRLRNCRHPAVLYADHGNWELAASPPDIPVSRRPWVCYRPEGEGYLWWNQSGLPSGHPGHRVDEGRLYVMPAPEEGLALYVDSDNGDDTSDGRTPEQAWQSLQKVADLFRNCTVATPFTVIMNGQNVGDVNFRDISGSGKVTLRAADGANLGVVIVKNVQCRLDFEGEGLMTIGELRADASQNLKLSRAEFAGATVTGTRLAAYGGSNVTVEQASFSGGEGVVGAVAAHENSRLYVANATFEGIPAGQELVATSGAVIDVKR